MAQKAKNESKLISILRSPVNSSKATLDTMMKIWDELGHFPDKITHSEEEGGGVDYETLVKLITILSQQSDPNVTEEQVRNRLTIDKLPEAMDAVNEMLITDAALELISEMEEAKEDAESTDAETDGTDEKN